MYMVEKDIIPSSFYHSPSVLSILLFIFLPSCPLPHTCQLCLPALSKLEFIREGVNMEKDGDSEEDNDEEVVK
jgi:hypothetical protein